MSGKGSFTAYSNLKESIMYKIGYIGAGNMGLPEISATARFLGAGEVCFFEKDSDRAAFVAGETGAASMGSVAELVKNSEYTVIVVKPQVAPFVYDEIRENLHGDSKIITSMAGVTTETIAEKLGSNLPIIRWMPNLPAMVGEGMTAMSVRNITEDDEAFSFAKSLCEAFGKVVVIPENLMNAACCANGSSPAYVAMFIEALADSVVKYGIPRATAYTLAAQTVLGTAKLILETGVHPAELKDRVSSPAGTTIAAVSALEENGFRNAVIKATDACYEKSSGLSGK